MSEPDKTRSHIRVQAGGGRAATASLNSVELRQMTSSSIPPFSTRNRYEKSWIEDDFPESARNGLLHLLNTAVEKDYFPHWAILAKEVRRIARVAPRSYDHSAIESIRQARSDVEVGLNELDWEKVYDFCERLHSYLAEDAVSYRNGEEVAASKSRIHSFLTEEIQRLFDEEGLGYEFKDGLVQRRGKRHTTSQVTKAQKALADQQLESARRHFSKSLCHFRDRKEPDLQNAVKEAVCAVEAAAKELFPEAKAATLGDFTNWATKNDHRMMPKTIAQTFAGLYGFRNSGEGVSHGAATGGVVTTESRRIWSVSTQGRCARLVHRRIGL